jgi:hypothetical protein
MTIDKIENVWANAGSVDEPTDAKKDRGFVDGDQPAMERFNWLHKFEQDQINDIVTERVASYNTQENGDKAREMISTGLWDSSWGCGKDAANLISTGVTKKLKSIVTAWSATDEPLICVFDDTNYKIEVYNARTKALVDTSHALTADLPSGGGETWENQSMCTDGTYIYATFMNTNPTPNETHRIQAWLISDWSVKTGWAITGTALPGTGTGVAGTRQSIAIIADSSNLAVANQNVTITASTSNAISIVSIADGTISASGAGDANTIVSEAAVSLASDGTNIFFVTSDGSAGINIASATIADPTTGCGGIGYPYAQSGASWGYITSCGPNMMLIGYVVATSLEQDIVFQVANATRVNYDNIILGQTSHTAATHGSNISIDNVRSVLFDGLNLWAIGTVVNNPSTDQAVAHRVDLSKMALVSPGGTTQSKRVFDIGDSYLLGGDTAINSELFVDSTFDGRDIWCIMEEKASQVNSGRIFRLPLALIRG